MLTVRRAEPRDIPRLLELLLQVNMVHHEGRPDLFRGPTTKYSEAELAALLDDDRKPVFVCSDETDRVLGHCFCQLLGFPQGHRLMEPVQTLYVDDICVDESARGRGVGRALYEFILGFAREQGCYNVQLTVWSCNPGAQRFYEAMGMEVQKLGMETIL